MSTFYNVYEDSARAEAYAKLEFANTYYLAYRDLPQILDTHVSGKRALDFGCGTGRSARFLKYLGFNVTAVDISEEMLRLARQADPAGEYCLIREDNLKSLPGGFDLILSAFTFDNVPQDHKRPLFTRLRDLLSCDGVLINLVSAPEIYTHEWASFTTRDFPHNCEAKDGDLVQIITTDAGGCAPCVDVFCTDEAYGAIYREMGLKVVEMHRPIATGSERFEWVNETQVAPWVIWVLQREPDE